MEAFHVSAIINISLVVSCLFLNVTESSNNVSLCVRPTCYNDSACNFTVIGHVLS